MIVNRIIFKVIFYCYQKIIGGEYLNSKLKSNYLFFRFLIDFLIKKVYIQFIYIKFS